MTRHDDTVKAAAWAASRGWAVFPLARGKKAPGVGDWEHTASTNPAFVVSSWPRWSIGFGIAAGPSGLLVVDCDVPKPDTPPPPVPGLRDGYDALTWLAAELGETLPETFTVATPSGGRHLYFLAPPDVELRNTAFGNGETAITWCVDTRGGGGYIVGPGSTADGQRYRTVCPVPPVLLPAWILRTLMERRAASQRQAVERTSAPAAATSSAGGPVGREWVDGALRGELERIAAHPGTQGGRNHLLNSVAYTLGRLVGAGLLDRQAVADDLLDATRPWWGTGKPTPFSQTEAERTIASGLTAGERNPRTPSPRQTRMRPGT